MILFVRVGLFEIGKLFIVKRTPRKVNRNEQNDDEIYTLNRQCHASMLGTFTLEIFTLLSIINACSSCSYPDADALA